ncbi:hypothetical protein HRbin19_01694 [bacterium HR19]|nr:hypothetical protein HRbin19_01694 [bacterium HR19]
MEDLIKTTAKFIIMIGAIMILMGLIFLFISSLDLNIANFKLKKLPGDILIKKDNFTFFFPITTSIIISILLTLILNVIAKILGKH